MNDQAPKPDQVLIDGIYSAPDSPFSKKRAATVRAVRQEAFTAKAVALGVCSYEWLDGSRRVQANKMLARMRGTAPTVDAGAILAHYTTRHGPLVAGHARLIGLRSYRQVPDEQDELCAMLRELGMGRAPSPAVFAELVMGAPSIRLSTLKAYRAASREIKVDEKRHIDFSKSMLLMPRQG